MSKDIQTIQIDRLEIGDIPLRAANVEEIQNSYRKREQFDSEIMSIIGSINSRAAQIRSKINIAQPVQQHKEPKSAGLPLARESYVSIDPL